MNAPALRLLLAAVFFAGCATATAEQRAAAPAPSRDQRRISFSGTDYLTRDEVGARFSQLALEACGGTFSGTPQVDFDQTWLGKFYLTRYSASGGVSCGK